MPINENALDDRIHKLSHNQLVGAIFHYWGSTQVALPLEKANSMMLRTIKHAEGLYNERLV